MKALGYLCYIFFLIMAVASPDKLLKVLSVGIVFIMFAAALEFATDNLDL